MKCMRAEHPGRRPTAAEKIVTRCGLMLPLLVVCIADAAASSAGAESQGANWRDLAWRTFDFVVLAGFLYWILADKVKSFFSGREKAIKGDLEKVAADRGDAEKKFAEYSAKVDKATEELDSMADMIRQQGIAEKERIIADARRTAVKMKEDAEKRLEQEAKAARHALRKEAVLSSVQLARETLSTHIVAADHADMVENYIKNVVTK